MEIAVGMHQDQGKREYQQDAMARKGFGSIGVLAILADGMGGYEGGEIASKLVSENLQEFKIEGDDIGASLKKYLLKGNEAIRDYKQDHSEVKSMGTTAIGFFMTDKSCQWVSVGDSPLYVIRNRSTIKRINENHSVAGLLDLQVKRGDISQEEALASGQRHMLTSAISGEDIPQIDTSVSWSTKSDDIFILASDGIETISDERIKEIVLAHVPVATQENLQNACEALVQEVVSTGRKNQDNVTVILLARMEDGEPKTALYRPSETPKKNRVLLLGGAALIGLMFLAAIWYFMMGDKEAKATPDSKPNAPVSVAEEKKELNVASPAKSKDQNSSNSSDPAVKKPSPAKREEQSPKVESGESSDKKEELPKPEKSNKVQQQETEKSKKKLERNKIKIETVSPEEIDKRNKELEEGGGV